MIDLRSVAKRFPGRAPLLTGINVSVGRGERWGLIGPGAGGKNVLGKIMAGLVSADAGRVVVDGQDVTGVPEDTLGPLRSRFGMLFRTWRSSTS